MVSCICHDHSLRLSHIALILLSVHSVFCCFLQCLIPFDGDQVPQHVKGIAVWLHTQLLPLPVDDAQEAKVIQTTDLYFCIALALDLHAGSTAHNFSWGLCHVSVCIGAYRNPAKTRIMGYKDIYSPVTLKCTQEFVLVTVHSYSTLTNRHGMYKISHI